jgi:hypothetical protein
LRRNNQAILCTDYTSKSKFNRFIEKINET